MKLKILTLTTVYPSSIEPGLGAFIRTRLEHIAESAEVKVLAPVPLINYGRRTIEFSRRVPPRRWNGTLEVLAPRWFYPPGGGALNAVFLFLRILSPAARLRKEFRFQIIDAHFGHPEGVAAALLALALRCPFTVTLRGSELQHAQFGLRRTAMKWALRRASRVIAVAEKLRTFAIGLGANPSRAVTIPNGVDTSVFHRRDRAASRAEYGVAAHERLIVSAGHLIELKGHHRIIRALPRLLAGGLPVKLLIAGGRGRAEDYEPELRREITRLGLQGRVALLGHLECDALARLMSAADVFCLASSREGWPNVIHEALACGVPVVAANVGGVPEMIPSEQFGLVVPADDPDALAAALSKALSQSWDRDAIAVWGQARSWRQVAAEAVQQMELACQQFPL